MPDINAPITYSDPVKRLIDAFFASAGAPQPTWGSEELELARVEIRKYYRAAQQGKCAYCKNDLSLSSASNCHVEHIAPKSKYPKFIFEPRNLCVICADCNTIKRDQEVMSTEPDPLARGNKVKIYPRSPGAFFIVHPHFDCYSDHIQKVGKYFIDKSPKGHFTIGACRLNRHIHEFGWDPVLFEFRDIESLMKTFLESTDQSERFGALARLKEALALC